MEKFDVHKWNKQRRASMLNEGFGAEVIDTFRQMYRNFRINSKREDRETMKRIEHFMGIIEKAYDLYDLGAIDEKTLDGILNKYGKMFQDEIDNSSDSFTKYTDFERSTD